MTITNGLPAVPFVSQHDFRISGMSDLGCGVAALMMLLRYERAPRRLLSVRRLCRELKLHIRGSDKGIPDSPGCGVYLEDVIRFFDTHRIAGEARRLKPRRGFVRLKNILRASPVMVEMGGDARRWGSYGHWIVLRGASNGEFHYLDPAYKKRSGRFAKSITENQFLREWTGDLVFLERGAA